MLSTELLEAQNSVGCLNTLFYTDQYDDPKELETAKRYGAMLISQFEEVFTEYLDATEEYFSNGSMDRTNPDYLHDFVNDNLKLLQLKSLVSLSGLIAVLKAQSRGDGSPKSAFALTADNKQTLSSLDLFIKNKLFHIRSQMTDEEDNDDTMQVLPNGKMAVIETGDQNAEFWGDLKWANILLENPDHPIHTEYARYSGFHIGPALESAIVTTREHMEFFASFYFYMQKQSGLNNTEIPQDQIDYFTEGTDEISTILIALRNLACNDMDIQPDGENTLEIAQSVSARFGELRIH